MAEDIRWSKQCKEQVLRKLRRNAPETIKASFSRLVDSLLSPEERRIMELELENAKLRDALRRAKPKPHPLAEKVAHKRAKALKSSAT
jgi:hypothetical protein